MHLSGPRRNHAADLPFTIPRLGRDFVVAAVDRGRRSKGRPGACRLVARFCWAPRARAAFPKRPPDRPALSHTPSRPLPVSLTHQTGLRRPGYCCTSQTEDWFEGGRKDSAALGVSWEPKADSPPPPLQWGWGGTEQEVHAP